MFAWEAANSPSTDLGVCCITDGQALDTMTLIVWAHLFAGRWAQHKRIMSQLKEVEVSGWEPTASSFTRKTESAGSERRTCGHHCGHACSFPNPGFMALSGPADVTAKQFALVGRLPKSKRSLCQPCRLMRDKHEQIARSWRDG